MRDEAELQGELFDRPAKAAPPEGFGYWPNVIDAVDEAELAAQLAQLPFKPFEFHGYLGNRRTVSFGLRYDYGKQAVQTADPAPAFLISLRERISELAGVPADDFVQVLINEYAPGAGIGWHRDRPQFGLVAGVSLLTPATLRFRRKVGAGWERTTAPLVPRSAYLLGGPARQEWQHSITPTEALRYSITYRTLAS